ncbi:hypothetical protein ATCC90586_003333 [Pythium insidiosum]|nr:hypothetical protein ATCC90586_003333 [Pythium insidiosum]
MLKPSVSSAAAPVPSSSSSALPQKSASFCVDPQARPMPTAPPASSPRRATVALVDSPSTTAIYDRQLLWKLRGQKKLESVAQDLAGREDQECTFNPKVNRSSSVRKSIAAAAIAPDAMSDSSSLYSFSPRSMDSERHGVVVADEDAATTAAMAVFPTEAQEHSIRLYLARQERAREAQQKAQHKLLSVQPRKDFNRVTTAEPFALSASNRDAAIVVSISNRKRIHGTRSQRRDLVDLGASSQSGIALWLATVSHFHKRRLQRAVGGSHRGVGDARPPERLDRARRRAIAERLELAARETLLGIIDTQRRELESRETAYQDATRIAESFASAVETFEERLAQAERSTASELSEMKQLLARQASAMDQLLYALGLSTIAPPPAPAPTASAAASPVPPGSSASRRETK